MRYCQGTETEPLALTAARIREGMSGSRASWFLSSHASLLCWILDLFGLTAVSHLISHSSTNMCLHPLPIQLKYLQILFQRWGNYVAEGLELLEPAFQTNFQA